MASTHEHLEHAEHAAHNAHDSFNQRVAVSMAIIAACLAAVGTLSHRKHNDVLRIGGDANRLRTEAAAADVEKSNRFGWYQSKKTRMTLYEAAVLQVSTFPADAKEPSARRVVEDWKKESWWKEVTSKEEWEKQKLEVADINKKGKEKEQEAKELLKKADATSVEAEHNHHQADRLDIAHLSAEIGLVVCSLALLTKRRGFWYFGMAATVVSMAVAGSAYLMEHHEAADHPQTHAAPETPAKPAGDAPAKPAGDGHGH